MNENRNNVMPFVIAFLAGVAVAARMPHKSGFLLQVKDFGKKTDRQTDCCCEEDFAVRCLG